MVVDKKVQTLKAYKKAKNAGKHKNFNYSAYYDRFHKEINIRIAECLALRARFEKEDAAGTSRRRNCSKRRKLVDVEELDDDESDSASEDDEYSDDMGYNYQRRPKVAIPQRLRSSPQKKLRAYYNEPYDMPGFDHDIYAPTIRYVSANNNPIPQDQGRSITEANNGFVSFTLRKVSCSELFEAGGNRYKMPEKPIDIANTPPLTDAEIDWMIALERRKSNTMSTATYLSIMKSPRQDRIPFSPQTPRSASFNTQPVTSSTEYYLDDPPSQVAGSCAIRSTYGSDKEGRRSARLALKTTF